MGEDRGCSSNGRALAQHARGTGIDTLHLQPFCFEANISQSAGFEPARAEPSGFLVHPLNRLGTTAAACGRCPLQPEKQYPWWDSNPQSLA